MKRLAFLLAVLVGCNEHEANSYLKAEGSDIMASPITAADHVGPVPVPSITVVDDGDYLKADDLRVPVAALLANDDYIIKDREATHTFAEEGAGPTYAIGPPNLFNSATYTDSKVVVDVADCAVDDDVEIVVWGDWQLNTASASTVVGRARINIMEDVDGAPLTVPNVYGKASVATPGGGTLPHVSNYHLSLRHRVTTAGKVRAALQIATEDLSGGAGTATVILQLSARMDVKHIKRN